MAKRKAAKAVSKSTALKVFSNATEPSREQAQMIANGFASAIGFGGTPGFGNMFSGSGSNPIAPQISQTNVLFENMRWYLISNFRQPLSEAYVEIGLLQTVVDVPVDDALRGGIEIQSKHLDEADISELLVSMDRDDDLNNAGQAAKWNRLYGGAGILIIVGDQDPEMPLDIASIGPDTDLEFRPVDMWELFWDKQNTEGYDPEIQTEDFECYNYYARQIHKSRVLRLKGITAPSFIRPRLRGWGFSVLEILIRSINQYLKATDLSFAVLDEFKVDVYKIKNLVTTLLSPEGEQKISQRIKLANWQKNYQNALVMDSEDDWDHKQLTFAGLAETMEGIRMQVAADMRMPITKLFGTTASKGLGQSDQNDMENYNSMVESQVRNKIKYHILRMIEIRCQKLFGFIPDDLKVDFKPLRVLSAEQEENVKNAIFARVVQAFQLVQIDNKQFVEACNRAQLLPIQIEVPEGIDPTAGNIVEEGEEDPYDSKDVDDPGADREDTRKPRLANKKPVSNEFQEAKHPRAEDGKFGSGGGSSKDLFKEKYKSKGVDAGEFHSADHTKDEAVKKAKELRSKNIHATIWHLSGPKSGESSNYAIAVPPKGK